MLFVSRLTLTSFVPSTFATAFSTRAEQAEHVMPVIVNCSFFILDFSLLGGYWENDGSLHNFLQGRDKLIDDLIVAGADIVDHAGLDVLREQFLVEGIEC